MCVRAVKLSSDGIEISNNIIVHLLNNVESLETEITSHRIILMSMHSV